MTDTWLVDLLIFAAAALAAYLALRGTGELSAILRQKRRRYEALAATPGGTDELRRRASRFPPLGGRPKARPSRRACRLDRPAGTPGSLGD
jgi:hypothetical protein